MDSQRAGWIDLITVAVEFMPLVGFFVASRYGNVFFATSIFIGVTLVCAVALWIAFKSVSPLFLFNTAMVIIFGGLTLLLHNDLFIKVKPTVDYSLFTAALIFGLANGKLIIKSMFGLTFPGLKDEAWRVLTRNWAAFFLVLAAANEIVWRTTTTESWITYRVWAPPLVTLLFGVGHVHYLLRQDEEGSGRSH